MNGWPEPAPADATTAPWWDATRDRRLLLQRCGACHSVQHPPRAVCTICGEDDLGWATTSGRGTVDAWTSVHRAPTPGLETPYVVARVCLDEGPVLLTNLEPPAHAWRCGAPVQVVWRPLPDGRQLPVFVPLES